MSKKITQLVLVIAASALFFYAGYTLGYSNAVSDAMHGKLDT